MQINNLLLVPANIIASKITKDEKIVATVMMGMLSDTNTMRYDQIAISKATGLSISEVNLAVKMLCQRGLLSQNEENLIVKWGFGCER